MFARSRFARIVVLVRLGRRQGALSSRAGALAIRNGNAVPREGLAKTRRVADTNTLMVRVSRRFRLLGASALAAVQIACAASDGGPTPAVSTATASAALGARPPVASAAPGASAAAGDGSCGALGCRLFDTPRKAFEAVLADRPRVLAIGESHAPKGQEGVASVAKRFTNELLPALDGRASDILVEAMAPPQGCKAKTEQVRTKQKVVTEQQASTNQSEYLTLGNEAKRRGIIPDLLRPTCADLDAIERAGDDAIAVSLTTIARLTKGKVSELVDGNAKRGEDKIVVTYGGALHNDIEPSTERAAWSFGPDLSTKVGGRYVELDVFVREFIQDGDSWQKFEWFKHFDRERYADKAVLFHPRPASYVLILPRG
jgi:hypothetical protein